MICLPKELTQKFLNGLKDGSVNPEDLSKMTSEERRSLFEDIVGKENAKSVNALFEEKMLLKDQQSGMITWAKEVGGLKPEARREMIDRINKLERVLNPAEERTFLNDLASKKLGTEVTVEEAKKLSELAKDATEKKNSLKDGGDRMEYGRARVALDNYVSDLKSTVKEPLTTRKAISNLAGLAKSLKATLDNSVIGRQGLKVLLTEPKIWLKNSIQSFVDIVQTFGGKEVMDEVKADVLSRENSLNGLYRRERLAVGVTEEAYPTNIPIDKIPVLGKAYKASEAAFTAFQYRTRADVFDKYVEMVNKAGGDVKGVGLLANALTGRGDLGRLESSANTINNVFFSPRLMKSNIDALTGHIIDRADMGTFARKKAAINTVKIIGAMAGILAIAKAINPKSVETDPRSADFGKIKIGDTRFDISGGMSGLVTLAFRLARMSTKSSTSGKITKLNSGKFGSQTGFDILSNFFENKLSPVASILKDILQGQDFQGNKPSVLEEANNLFTPLPITNFLEIKNNPKSANIIGAMIADGLGISTNTYSPQKTVKPSTKGRNLMQIMGITK